VWGENLPQEIFKKLPKISRFSQFFEKLGIPGPIL
jgi:hypothetical protein